MGVSSTRGVAVGEGVGLGVIVGRGVWVEVGEATGTWVGGTLVTTGVASGVGEGWRLGERTVLSKCSNTQKGGYPNVRVVEPPMDENVV
jgi:hypothetical protein